MSTRGLLQRGIPPQPPFLRILKIVVLVLSLIILALAAYAISLFNNEFGYYGDGGAGGLLIFVAIKTFIIFGIALYLEIAAPHLFYRIIGLVAFIISIIFWLSAWAWSASLASFWLSLANDDCVVDDAGNLDCGYYAPFKNEGAALAAAAGLGAVTWILLIVHLVFYIQACLRDPEGTGAVTQQQAELGQVKAQEAQAPAGYPPQQGYQQPYQQPYQQQPYQQPYEQPQQQPYPAQ